MSFMNNWNSNTTIVSINPASETISKLGVVNSNTTIVSINLGKHYLAEFIMENSNTTIVSINLKEGLTRGAAEGLFKYNYCFY